MKKFSGLLFILSILMACNSDSKDSASQRYSEEKKIEKPSQLADVPWTAVVDSMSQNIKMVQSIDVPTQDLDIKNVTEVLTRKYPEIKIIWLNQQRDTAFISIPDSHYLTQSSGSMGAYIFMAEVTYAYTQIPGINFVNFAFKEGDHASPGTFKRSNFTFSK